MAVELRRARAEDVPAIAALLAADPLGARRERRSGDETYRRAFAAVDADPAQLLVVATAEDDIVGTFQLSFIPGLSRAALPRAAGLRRLARRPEAPAVGCGRCL